MVDKAERKAVQAEYGKCKKDFFSLKEEYQVYKVKSAKIVRQQERILEILQDEKKNLDTLMTCVQSKQNVQVDEVMYDRLDKLLEIEKTWERTIKEEKECISELDSLISKTETQLKGVCSEKADDSHRCEKLKQMERRRSAVEDKVQRANSKLSMQLLKNKELREEIRIKMFEKNALQRESDKLVSQLEQAKSDIMQGIRGSMHCNDEWRTYAQRVHFIESEIEKTKAGLEYETEEQHRWIKHHEKLHKFFASKNNPRKEIKEKVEKEHKRRFMAALEADRSRLKSYEDIFNNIRASTKKKDIDCMVEHFLETENDNFSLFNHVINLGDEVERLEKQNGKLVTQIFHLQEEQCAKSQKKKKLMEELEAKYDDVLKKSASAQWTLRRVHKALECLRIGVVQLFEVLHCDLSEAKKLLENDAAIKDMVYLGVIEKKVEYLLNVKYNKEFEGCEASISNESFELGKTKWKVRPPDLPFFDFDEDSPKPIIEAELEPVDINVLRTYIMEKLEAINVDAALERDKQQRTDEIMHAMCSRI